MEGASVVTNDLANVLRRAVLEAEDPLYIIIKGYEARMGLSTAYSLLRQAYQLVTNMMFEVNKQLLDVRVLLHPDYCNLGQSKVEPITIGLDLFPKLAPRLAELRLGQFGTVAIGGTFDHLHSGHKLMLSVAVMLTKNGGKLIVGVTDDDKMIASKQFKDQLETCTTRSKRIDEFLRQFSLPNGISINIITLTDPFGPTIKEPGIEALVVSPETLPGAQSSKHLNRKYAILTFVVNLGRIEAGNIPMHLVAIDLIEINDGEGHTSKLGSTLLRSIVKRRHLK